jgi:hypothetical protein
MSSSDTLLQLINGLERDPAFMQFWEEQVHSAFVYAGDDSEILRKLIRRLTGDNGIVISKINPGVGDLTVSDQLDDFCRVMAGVRTAASKADFDTSLIFNTPKVRQHHFAQSGGTFLKQNTTGVLLFSTSKEIIDIDTELTSQNFDVRAFPQRRASYSLHKMGVQRRLLERSKLTPAW